MLLGMPVVWKSVQKRRAGRFCTEKLCFCCLNCDTLPLTCPSRSPDTTTLSRFGSRAAFGVARQVIEIHKLINAA